MVHWSAVLSSMFRNRPALHVVAVPGRMSHQHQASGPAAYKNRPCTSSRFDCERSATPASSREPKGSSTMPTSHAIAGDPLTDPGGAQRAAVADHLEIVKRAADAGAACRAGPAFKSRPAGRTCQSRVAKKQTDRPANR